MKLENQLSSLEPSKKLKELGVKQESLWYWYQVDFSNPIEWKLGNKRDAFLSGDRISAFTVAELGGMLPEQIWTYRYKKQWWTFWNEHIHKILGIREMSGHNMHTEANARAKLLIHLIEKGIVKP